MYQNYDEELMHYGVKGMRWGVRKDVRLVANSQRNKKVAQIKKDYKSGNITREEKKQSISKANADKKKNILKMYDDYDNARSESERYQIENNITNAAKENVRNAGLKRTLSTASEVFTGYEIANIALGAMAITSAMPMLGPIVIGAAAVDTAAAIGLNALAQMGLDKIS